MTGCSARPHGRDRAGPGQPGPKRAQGKLLGEQARESSGGRATSMLLRLLTCCWELPEGSGTYSSHGCQAAPAPTSSASLPRQPVPPVCKSAPVWKSSSAGVPDASSAGTGLTPGMLAAVPLPPCAEGVPEAAAPQAARPGSFSPPAATGCCEGNAPESRKEKPGPPPNPEESVFIRPQSNPPVLLAGSELEELPAPYQRGFPVHWPLQGWAGITAPAQPSFAVQRGAERSQVRGDGAESVWRAGSYVSASAGRRGKPVQPAARLHRCLFPNCSRNSMQNTCLCCQSPQPGAEERWAGAAGAPAEAKGLGAGQVWP